MVDVVGSFMRGFQSGAGVVDQYNQRERNRKLDERQDMLFEQSQEDRKQRLADAQTQRERGETLWQEGREDRKTSLADAEANRARQKTLQGREDTQWKQSQEQYNHQQTLQRRQEADQMTKDWLNGMAEQGQYIPPPPELEAYYDENPQLDISNTLTPESVIGRQQARQIMQQLAAGETIDRQDPRLINSLNQLFPEIVNNPALPTTYQGQPIQSREISSVDIAPNGNGFMVTQRLTLGNGEQVDVPVTQNRGSDPSDQVVVVPFELASQRLSSLDKLDLNLDDDTKQQLFRSRVMRGLAKAGVDTKDKSGIQKQMLAQLDELNTLEQQALSDWADDPEQRQQIAAQYDQMRQRTRDTYAEFIGQTGQKPAAGERFKAQVDSIQKGAERIGVKWTPEVKAEVEELIRAETPVKLILQALQEEYGGSEDSPENAKATLDSIIGGDSGQGGGQPQKPTRPGEFEPGRFYNVGSDVFKPNVRNEAQAEMTPYQAQTNQPTTLQQAYGAR